MRRTKTRRDMKSKLIAAICMLMVSVIMMASTSYAWFTLSTAPEVKGIQTAVGANGNLEIALLSTNGSYSNPGDISSAVGDSSAAENKSPITANITWGNLIDLSHESYGLGMITLMPAQLMNEGNYISGEQLLAVPSYGADGRVIKVSAENTIMATYNNAKKSFAKYDTTAADYNAATAIHYGLRAIGGSTNRSVREMMFDTYMSKGAMAASQAKTAAANSLNAYGGFLANLGIKGASDASATFTAADVEQMQAMLNSITGYDTYDDEGVKTGHTSGVIDYLQEALQNYGIAVLASALNTATYENDAAFTAAMQALLDNPSSILTTISTYMPDEMAAASVAIGEVREIAQDAQSRLNGLTGSSFTWGQISGIVGALFDADGMTFCGMTLDEVRDPGDPDDPTTSGLVQLQTKMQEDYNNQLVAAMTGGIYSEIADLTDGFSGSAYLTVEGMTVKAVMQANKTGTERYLMGQVNAAIAAKPAPKGASAAPSISDPYGYVIDMAFRTNASGSKLLLQTAPEQRIDTSSDDGTMGGGSSMTFTSVDGFSTEKMKSLMQNINVVFFLNDGETKQILAYAKLDTANAKPSGNDVTADLKIWDGTAFKSQADAVIVNNMPTNTAVKVSALVYLDGTSISNGDVGTGALSMTGRMNLQFSSSANLVPMDYSGGYAPANPVPEATETTGAANP